MAEWRARLGLGLFGLLSLACGAAEPTDVWLGLPEAGAAKTLLIGVPERSSARVYLHDLEASPEGWRLEIGARDPDEAPLELAYFTRALDEVGLREGWQNAPAAGVIGAPLALGPDALLGPARAVFEARPTEEELEWRAADALSSVVGGYEVERPNPRCQALYAPNVSTEIPFAASWAIALTPTLVLVGDPRPGAMPRLLDSTTGQLRTLTGTISYSAGVTKDGVLYLGDRRGQVWTGQADPYTALSAPRPLGGDLPGVIRGVAAGGPDDVFVITNQSVAHHFDGEAWTELGEAPDARLPIEWVGPGEALLMTDTPGIVYHLTPDEVRPERIAESGVLSAEVVPGLGVLAGTSDGDVLRREAAGWGKLGDRRYGWWVVDIVPWTGGAAFLLASGTVGGYQPGIGHCEDLYNTRLISRGWLVPQQGGLLLIGKLANVDRSQVVLLEPL